MAKNTIRNEELSEDLQRQMADALEEKIEKTQSFLRSIFPSGHLSSYLVAKNLPFAGFLVALALLYIANRHLAERTVRSIDQLGREVKELKWDYKSLSAQLMKKATQTEIAKKAHSLGLKDSTVPAIRVEVKRKRK